MTMIKRFAYFLTTIFIVPLNAGYLFLGLFLDKNRVFASCSQLLSLIPGIAGSYFRNGFYHLSMTRCDYGVVLSFATLFSQFDTEIAAGTYIGPQCNIGSCKIGKKCLIGSGVHILSGKQQHIFDSVDIPIQDQGGRISKISIGDDCWIGNGAIIMADIGNQCVIAAGAVVVNPVPDRMIVAGNPATVIKKRQ